MTRRTTGLCLLASWLGGCDPIPSESSPLSGDEWVHDPSRLVEEGGEWVLYGSGTQGMALTRSVVDLETGEVLATEGLDADTLAGAWWRQVQEWNPTGEFDAPSVSEDGRLLAFTVFDEEDGQIRDATGIAVRTEAGFVAGGVVLSSEGEEADTARAMDASFLTTDAGTFLVFGSHAGGIYVTELDPRTGRLLDDGDSPETEISPERFTPIAQDEEAGIEAPTLHVHDGRYTLFVNKGRCCSGVDSTYRVVVGQSDHIDGPYLDRDGVDLREGGGTPFLEAEGRFLGPGHVGIRKVGEEELVGFHFYDGEDDGIAKYALRTLHWVDGWPEVGELRAVHRQ